MMRNVWEKVGDRVLRSVLPQERAAACTYTGYTYDYSSPSAPVVVYRSSNTCNGVHMCKFVPLASNQSTYYQTC